MFPDEVPPGLPRMAINHRLVPAQARIAVAGTGWEEVGNDKFETWTGATGDDSPAAFSNST